MLMTHLFLVLCVCSLFTVKLGFAESANCNLFIPKVPRFEVSEVTVVEALGAVRYLNERGDLTPLINVLVIPGSLGDRKLSLSRNGLDLVDLINEILELSGEKYHFDNAEIWLGVDSSEVYVAKRRYPMSLDHVVIPHYDSSYVLARFNSDDASEILGLLWADYNPGYDWDLEVTLRNEEFPELNCRHLGFGTILAYYDLCAGKEELRPVVVLRINSPKE